MLDINPNLATTRPHTSEKKLWLRHRTACVVIFIFSFVLYVNTLQHGFVLDDVGVLEQNAFVQKGVAGIGDIFANRTWEGHKLVNKTVLDFPIYRPLSLAFFAVEYEFFGLNPQGYHFLQVLFYAVLCAVVYLFLTTLHLPHAQVWALVGTVLFAAHPVHTEVVANIKSRDELLCMLFSISSLYCLLRAYNVPTNRQVFWKSLGFVTYLLALFSKETALTMLAVMPLTLFFFVKEIKIKDLLIPFAVYSASAAFVLVIRQIVLSDGQSVYEFTYLDNPVFLAKSLSENIGTRLWALSEHLRLLLWPHPLVCGYNFDAIPLVGMTHWRSVLAILLYAGIAAVFLFGTVKKNLWAYCAGFFLLTLSLYSNTFYTLNNLLGERWLFTPSLAVCMFFATAGVWFANKKVGASNQNFNIYCLLPLVLLLFYVPKVFSRNADWKNAHTLFVTDAEESPRNCLLQLNAAKALLAQTETDEEAVPKAIYYFRKSLSIDPSLTEAQFKLGQSYMLRGQLDSASMCLEALKNGKYKNVPKEAPLFLAFCYNRLNTAQRNNSKAMELLKTLKPDDWAFDPMFYHQEFAVAAHALKDYETAILSYEKAIADPSAGSDDMQFLLTNLGHCYRSKDYLKSLNSYRKALKYAPEDPQLKTLVQEMEQEVRKLQALQKQAASS
ncbi:MAG: DUF1736 domain-containing protein [Cytophagales bacterium]|nr:MAG: DUF1736 domain-containing protein [Cytophagales bacterium]